MKKATTLIIILFTFLFSSISAQEQNPFLTFEAPSQNLVKFNRFLINPTFSTVREDKSYINLFHRNQSVSFDDNNQSYFLSYSGRVGDRSGVGVSVYTEREGLFSNFGVLANYAYGVKLSEKSNFTFGGNFSYYTSGFDQGRANTLDAQDAILNSLDDSALITFQPGFNISYGQFDFGAFAENLFDFNLRTSESNTTFSEKTYSGHLQYTHQFKNSNGILESGRLIPLARVRSVGQDNYTLGGNLILDLPKIGWLQAGYDETFGAAAGIGFNLNKHISLGYTIERGINNSLSNLGTTHEISLAYSFTPNLTEDRVLLEKDNEDLADNEEPEIEEISITEKDALIAELEEKIEKNNAILNELVLRQDSLENGRQADLERRFNMVMRLVKRESNGNSNLTERAEKAYLTGKDDGLIANNGNSRLTKDNISPEDVVRQTTSTKNDIISLKNNERKRGSIAANTERSTSITKDKIYKPTTKKPIGIKSFTIPEANSGYYIIANVYKDKKNMANFIEELESQGLSADYVENPRNGRNYVYLKKFENKQEAISAYKSKIGGAYTDDMWVMKIKGSDDYTDTRIASGSSIYESNDLQKNIVKNSGNIPNEAKVKTYNLDGIGGGYYIIANVFAKTSNANRFVKEMNAKGLFAGYFTNPENNYKYVYLKKHDTWTNALTSYYNKLDNAYENKMWIMRVKNSTIS